MSLRFADSFSHYATADILDKWTAQDFSASTSISAGNGRNSNASWRISSPNGPRSLSLTLDAQQTWIMGCAFKTASLSLYSNSAAGDIMSVRDAGSAQCDLRVLTDGTLRATRNGTTLGTTSFAISANTFYYIEWKVKIDNTTGTIDVQVNGSNKLSLTGLDTQNTANATANQVVMGNLGGNSNTTSDFGDFYACDGQGSAPTNTFLGDVRIEAKFTNGAGVTTEWTPSAGSNFQNVDETAPDDDTTFNSSSTINQVDTYAYPDITPGFGTVFGVQVLMNTRKDDGGTRTIAPVVRSGSTNYVGNSQNISTSYLYYRQMYEQNPDTAAVWTVSGVNAAEFGIKIIA